MIWLPHCKTFSRSLANYFCQVMQILRAQMDDLIVRA